MKLVFIHGRDQQGKNPLRLKEIWIETWKKGLEKQALDLPTDLQIEFPFYGDLLHELTTASNVPENIDGVIARGSIGQRDLEFINDFLTDIAINAKITDQEIIQTFNGDIRERGPLNWEWIQALLKVLDKTNLGSLSLKRFTYDAYMYLNVPAIRRKIEELVLQKMDGDRCVIVGHSLGSVVGYNILRNNDSFKVNRYITVGSPLGLRSIKGRLDVPIRMPNCILNGWFNAYDQRDVVALQPLNRYCFDIEPEIENYDGVRNSTDNKHGIEGYLDDAVVARAIYDALAWETVNA